MAPNQENSAPYKVSTQKMLATNLSQYTIMNH